MELRRSIKSNAHIAMIKNSEPMQKFFLRGGWGEQFPTQIIFSKLPKLSETSGARKIILGLPVNIDKGNGHRNDVTLWMVYRGSSKDPQSAHQCTVTIFCEIKFKFNGISMLFPVHWLSMDQRK